MQPTKPNPNAKLPMQDKHGNEILEFRVKEVAVFLQERLGIYNFSAARERVYRMIKQMNRHPRVEGGEVIEEEVKKIGGTILIKRKAVIEYFMQNKIGD